MAGVNRMTGAPWHVEKMGRQEGDERRHRSRCKYHRKNDNYCSKRFGVCVGSVHCSNYEEVSHSSEDGAVVKPNVTPTAKKEKNKDLSSDELEIVNALRKPGTLIWHKKYDVGEVVAVKGETAKIRFDSGKESDFDIHASAASGLIRIL